MIQILLLGGVSIVFVLAAMQHFRLIMFPYPAEYREPSVLLSTKLILEGGSPWNVANLPIYLNQYGVLYHLFVLPVVAITGTVSFWAHRLVSAFFLLASCGLLAFTLRREELPLSLAYAIAVVLYTAGLIGVTPVARCDTAALFLGLLSVLWPIIGGFSLASVCVAGAIAGVSFFAKPFMIISIGPLLLYLLSCRRIGAMFASGVICGVTLVIGLALCHLILGEYLSLVITMNSALSFLSVEWALGQFQYWCKDNAPLILGLVLTVTIRAHSWRSGAGAYALICFSWFTVIVLGYLGQHTGANFTYFTQLMTPSFLLCLGLAFARFEGTSRQSAIWSVVLLTLILGSSVANFHHAGLNTRVPVRPWRMLDDRVAASTHVLGNSFAVPILLKNGRPVYRSGQELYLQEAFDGRQDEFEHLPELLAAPEVLNAWTGYEKSLARKLGDRAFDLVVTDPIDTFPLMEVLNKFYRITGEDNLVCFHTRQHHALTFWEPKP